MSPASSRLRVGLALVILAWWLVLVTADVFTDGWEVPLWSDAVGFCLLSYLLGISLQDVIGYVGARR